jgi:acetylornithine deacetylase
MVEAVCELVRIPSVAGPQEAVAQEKMSEWMGEVGLEIDEWELDLPSLRDHPAYSAEVHREEGVGLVGSMGENRGGRSLILNGHVDVVPPGELKSWSFPPWEGGLDGNEIRGRGALDMKGGLLCALFAAKAILASGVRLKGRLILESVIGEEDGGVGTLAAVERGYRADGAVIMEPTGMQVCPAQAGALGFRITVRGRAAHGCLRPEGISALEKGWSVYEALMALEARRNHYCTDPLFRGFEVPFPLSVGKVRGGEWASSVPDWIVLEGRYGFSPDEEVEAAREQLEEALSRAAAEDPWLREVPPELEWWGGRFLPARTPTRHPLVRELRGAFRELHGMEPPLSAVNFGSDMRLLVREADTPTVLFGPGDIRRAHAPDEAVAVEELEMTLRTLALFTLRFCGHEDD